MNQQEEMSRRNREAWDYHGYEYWCCQHGPPAEVARGMRMDPSAFVREHSPYLGDVKGKRIINLLGSCGTRAVPLALLGAQVTVVDISSEGRQYAIELASDAGVTIDYVVSDLFELALESLREQFDIVYAEGAILVYCADIHCLGTITLEFLKAGGRFVLEDSHPLRKIVSVSDDRPRIDGDYFDQSVRIGTIAGKETFAVKEAGELPTCRLRLWTLGELVTGLAQAGLRILQLVETPREGLPTIPGSFVLVACK